VPVETGVGFVAIQFEKICLVKGLRVGEVFPGTIAPVFYKPAGHFGDRQVAIVFGAEVPGSGILFRILPQSGAELQVAAEGFQDELPGPDGMGAADANGLVSAQGADAIGYEAIHTPVAAADNVARPGGGGAETGAARRNLRILGTRSTPFGMNIDCGGRIRNCIYSLAIAVPEGN